MNPAIKPHITLSELQKLIKSHLEGALPFAYWIVAEVSEIKVNYSGHCYMQLVEKSGKSQQPQAAASAVVWRSSYGSISSYFRSATGGDIAAGMKLLLKVAVSYHELYGLSLVISDIDPAYTLGDIERERQQTILRLQQDGVFDMNRELPQPVLLQRIAIVSSRNAAGYQDFMHELEKSAYHFELTLFDSVMQGDSAEDSIIASLDAISVANDMFDAVVIIRGGGSQSDLSCFNSYRLCAHVAQFPIPVITGIGHEKDRSVTDMVASLELKTPTAVATYLIEKMMEEEQYLFAAQDRVTQYATANLDVVRKRMIDYSVSLQRACMVMTRTMEFKLRDLGSKIVYKKDTMLAQRDNRLSNLQSLIEDRVAKALNNSKSRLSLLESKVQGRDPQRILSLGFAIVRSSGVIIKNSGEIHPADRIDITLAKGRVVARVEKTE